MYGSLYKLYVPFIIFNVTIVFPRTCNRYHLALLINNKHIIKSAVKNAKAGQIELKNDKDGNIGLSFGKKSFSDDNLIKNFNTVLDTLQKEKTNLTIKGDLIRNIFVTSTMGVAYKVKLGKNF